MSKKLLAACLSALSLAACQDEKPAVPPTHTAEVVHARTPVPVRPPVALLTDSDAGNGAPVDAGGPVDPLALAHDMPTFDHLARSKQLQEDGELRGALLEARRAVYSTPEDEETLVQLARLARRLKLEAMAAEAWGRVAALRPDDAGPLVQQGHALLAQGDVEGAMKAGRAAAARDETNPECAQVIGLAQLKKSDLAGAIGSFERAVELAPTHGWALNNLGFAYLRANENERAAEVLGRAAALLPNVALVQNNLGVALERTGHADEAKVAYQHAMDLSPKYVKARLNAARVAKAPTGDEPGSTVSEPATEVPVDAHPQPAPQP